MFNRYMLWAKRPHEAMFTEWCQTDNYEVVERNTQVIESYGWEWKLEDVQERVKKEQIRTKLVRAKKKLPPMKQKKVSKDQIKIELAREIFAELEFDIHQLMFVRDETRAIAIEGIIAALKKKHTEGEE